MSEFKPVECKEYPGFYEIHGYSRYAISKEGEVVDKRSGKILPVSFLRGYAGYNLIADCGTRARKGRHRLLLVAFDHPGIAIDDLVVNHIDGVPGSDSLNNLDWRTDKGNFEHAGAIGTSSKCIPIAVRDVYTGEVKEYPSIVDYARLMGWTKDKVNFRITIGEGRIFPEGKQYRPASVKTPWYIPEDIDLAILFNGAAKAVLVKDVFSGDVKEYPTAKDAARDLGIATSTVSVWLSFKNMPILPGYIQMKYVRDQRPWRPVGDPYLEVDEEAGRRIVVMIDDRSGEEYYFDSLIDCANKAGLKPTTLGFRLKYKGQKVFSDGFRYIYYRDKVLESQSSLDE